MEPVDGMQLCTDVDTGDLVYAGEITQVVGAGCYVGLRNGDTMLRLYPDTTEGVWPEAPPRVGDIWLIGARANWQRIVSRRVLELGYRPVADNLPGMSTSQSAATEATPAALDAAMVELRRWAVSLVVENFGYNGLFEQLAAEKPMIVGVQRVVDRLLHYVLTGKIELLDDQPADPSCGQQR